MKKVISLITIFLSCVVAACAVCLAGCSSDTQTQILDFSDCEIGYEIPVYPNCEFNYELSDDFIIHIEKITATLVEKNEIQENDTLTDRYRPYIIEISAHGSTTQTWASTNLQLWVSIDKTNYVIQMNTTVEGDGQIIWNTTYNITHFISGVYFSRIQIV